MSVVDRDLGMRALFVRLQKLGVSSLTVGVHEKDGSDQHEGSTATIADIGMFHEFGTTDSEGEEIVPERSWLRSTLDNDKSAIKRSIAQVARRITSNKVRMDPRIGIGIVGLDIQRRMQARIRKGISPPLSDARIKQKGSTVPLIDTGQFIQSITFEVL